MVNFVGITSGSGGMGKSSLACNIAFGLSSMGKKVLLIGDGADISYKFLTEKGLDVRKFSEIFKFQHASGVAITAYRNYNRGEEAVSADKLVPSYLRLSQAERELKKSGDAKK